MYIEHFGLKMLPFENVPDPAFFFDRGDYNRVLKRMSDALAADRGLVAVAGPIGSGKTTLSRKIVADLPPSTQLILLAEPPDSVMDLFLFLAQELGISEPPSTRVFLISAIRKRLLEIRSGGERHLMIVDESHLMPDEVLEGIRLLNDLEEGASKLIQIVLLGQQELLDGLARPKMEPLRQRIAGIEVIGRMDHDQVRQYIHHRLNVAGGDRPLLSDHAFNAVCLVTGGVPRVTNSLCDRALRIACEQHKNIVDTKDVHQAAVELGMGRKTIHYLLELRSGENTEAADCERQETEEAVTEPSRPAGLGPPLLLLLSSLAALTASFWFYCSRIGSSVPLGCLESLVRQVF